MLLVVSCDVERNPGPEGVYSNVLCINHMILGFAILCLLFYVYLPTGLLTSNTAYLTLGACTARVIVLVLCVSLSVCLSVCLFVCYPNSSKLNNYASPKVPTALDIHN